MWTQEELIEIRETAEKQASLQEITPIWRHACLNLASAADRLISIISRIEAGHERAVVDSYAFPNFDKSKPQ